MEKKEIIIRNCVFSFQCKGKWEKMELLNNDVDESTAFCSECSREVYLCKTDEIILKNIILNRCLAFDKELFFSHVPHTHACD